MANTSGTFDSENSGAYTSSGQWAHTIRLLKLVQQDYQGTRQKLEEVSQGLREKESAISQSLQYALITSGEYHTLRLVPYEIGSSVSRIGNTFLGDILPPVSPPTLVHIEIHCFGRFELRSSWKRVERWQSTKARSVLQFLLARHEQPVVRDVLMETLWPECEPQAASNNLKAAIHGLRRTLGHLFQGNTAYPYIISMNHSYQINPEIELWLDVKEFEEHWTGGRSLEKKGRVAEAITEYELAESLYRGDYLEDEPYAEWALLRRESLEDIYLIILGKLADYAMEAFDYESSIIYCQKILVKDRCREDTYRRLMCCYSRLGRRNRALRWYEICLRTVENELDTVPEPETSTLYQRLLKSEPI